MAELEKNPRLAKITPKKVEDEPPEILFRRRLKGHFAAPKLCRIWVLQVMRASRARGEFAVKYQDALRNKNHDGVQVFAHFFTIKYLSLHKPSMSVRFDSEGALKSTSVHVRRIRNYVWAYRHVLARRVHDMSKQVGISCRTIYDHPYMITHI